MFTLAPAPAATTVERRHFKKGLDGEDARRKREGHAISLRKCAREDRFTKRRTVTPAPFASFGFTPAAATVSWSSPSPQPPQPPQPNVVVVAPPMMALVGLVADLYCDDVSRQMKAAMSLRKLVANDAQSDDDTSAQSVLHQQVIDAGVLPRLVAFLGDFGAPDLQFEAAWILTNLASGKSAQTVAVAKSGAVSAFIGILRTAGGASSTASTVSSELLTQCIWALGNIAGDGPGGREFVLREGALPLLVALCPMAPMTPMSVTRPLMRQIAWTVSNLFRGSGAAAVTTPTEMMNMTMCVAKLVEFLDVRDEDVLADACWALSYIADDKTSENARIGIVVNGGVCRKLVPLLAHMSRKVRTPALRAIGNILTGDAVQTEAVLKCGVLGHLSKLMVDEKNITRKEACWAVSNITAGSASQILAVAKSVPDIFEQLIRLMKKDGDWEVKKEAAWAMSNATSEGSPPEVLRRMGELGLVEAFCGMLPARHGDARILMACLDGLENMLRFGAGAGKSLGVDVPDLVEKADGLDALEALQKHENEEIYAKAVEILQVYFNPQETADFAPSTSSLAPRPPLALTSLSSLPSVSSTPFAFAF
jgi:importin subunit alpha-1